MRHVGSASDLDVRPALARRAIATCRRSASASPAPQVMYRLLTAYWKGEAVLEPIGAVFFDAVRCPQPPAHPVRKRSRRVRSAAKFYFSQSFPDTASNRSCPARIARRRNRCPWCVEAPVSSSTSHRDALIASGARILTMPPTLRDNLAAQSAVVAGARGSSAPTADSRTWRRSTALTRCRSSP